MRSRRAQRANQAPIPSGASASRQTLRCYCLFCGGTLVGRLRGRDACRLACRHCHAAFVAEQNARGCLVGLRLVQCGTPDCCQLR